MEVGTRIECRDQVLVLGKMRKQAQLDLRIVRGHEYMVALEGHEAFPDAAPEIGAHGNVLQVGIGRRKAPGRRHRLIESGMEPTVSAAQLRQGVDIGSLDLGQLAVFQDEPGQHMLLRKLGQHLGIGRIAAARLLQGLEADHLEEHMPHLLGGIHVELATSLLIDLRHQTVQIRCGLGADALQAFGIQRRARALHLHQHGNQGQIDIAVHVGRAIGFQLIDQGAEQLEGGLGLERDTGLLPFGAVGDATQLALHQHLKRVIRNRAVQHIGGKLDVEHPGPIHLIGGDMGFKRGVSRVEHLEGGLGIEHREGHLPDHEALQGFQGAIPIDEGNPPAIGKRKADSRSEQGLLAGLAHRQAQRTLLFGSFHHLPDRLERIIALQGLDFLETRLGGRRSSTAPDQREHLVQMQVHTQLSECLRHRFGLV